MAENEQKKMVNTRSAASHERQMDIIMNLMRENHQLKQVCVEIYRGLGGESITDESIRMWLSLIESAFTNDELY